MIFLLLFFVLVPEVAIKENPCRCCSNRQNQSLARPLPGQELFLLPLPPTLPLSEEGQRLAKTYHSGDVAETQTSFELERKLKEGMGGGGGDGVL